METGNGEESAGRKYRDSGGRSKLGTEVNKIINRKAHGFRCHGLFERREWDSNPRAQRWTTAFRVRLVTTTSISLHESDAKNILAYLGQISSKNCLGL